MNKLSSSLIVKLWNIISLATPIILITTVIFDTNSPLTNPSIQANNLNTPSTSNVEKAQLYIGKPVTIYIPKLNHSVEVADGTYNIQDQTWSLGYSTAHYALITPQINTLTGNTFIYGHNTSRIFGDLTNLNEGEEVQITTDKGDMFSYKLVDFHEVLPSNTEALKSSLEPKLTIQTCTGNWDEKRGMFTFELVKVVPKA